MMIQPGPRPFKWVLTVLRDVAEALSVAYASRVVHMDVKLDNIMVDAADGILSESVSGAGVGAAWCGDDFSDPRAVLIDFGCALDVEEDGSISVARQHVLSFPLFGNQDSHAPELTVELDAAKREVRAS
jgi:serine/threonine protein kinase